MLEIEPAIDLLLQHTSQQDVVKEVNILDSVGNVVAEDIISSFSIPHSPRSAMDGYALMSQDTHKASREYPTKLRIIGQINAGDDKIIESTPGTAIRIMTGGMIPHGYDSVIKQEDTNYGEDIVEIYKDMMPWDNYRKVGEDIEKGQVVIAKFTRLHSRHIGVLASLGINVIRILKPMNVGIISTGAELVRPGIPIGPAQIYNSCGYMLASFLKSSGVEVSFMEICPDETEKMQEMIHENISNVDLLITTGGISVGLMDIVPGVLERLGGETLFQRVNMKPGTPVLASIYKGKIILSLSGNPFAALANFHIFFWPILVRFMSNTEFGNEKKLAVVKEGSMKASGLRRFIRAYEKDGYVILPSNIHAASVLSNVINCNCFIDQAPNHNINVGDTVSISYLKP